MCDLLILRLGSFLARRCIHALYVLGGFAGDHFPNALNKINENMILHVNAMVTVAENIYVDPSVFSQYCL